MSDMPEHFYDEAQVFEVRPGDVVHYWLMTKAELERLQAIAKAVKALLEDKQYRRLMGDGTFIWHECIFCGARLDHRHKDDCPVKALQTALESEG